MITQKIGFIGAGNMAQAIALGLIDAGAIDASNLTVSAPSLKNLERFKNVGANITHDNSEVITNSDIVFLAMKPQYLDSALNTIVNIPYEGKVYISILAGVKLETFEKKFKEKWSINNTSNNMCRHKIIRVLPNTAVLVGAGCSVMAPNANTTEEEVSLVKSILSVGGSCEVIPENLINSCSAVCGSGPAFIFMAIEALADGAVLRGVPRDLALRLAAKTVEGAGKLLLSTAKHPGQLKDEVCSPGGMTIAGVHQLEDSRMRCAFINAVQAAAKRADELSSLK